MKYSATGLLFVLLSHSGWLSAQPAINDMQSCQGLLDFVSEQLDSAPKHYSADDVEKVRQGLVAYNQFIQTEIVTPGVLKFNGGNAEKAKAMQNQIDAYKVTLVKRLHSRYPDAKLTMDQVVSINNCTKKSVLKGPALESLKVALTTMVKLAKSKQ